MLRVAIAYLASSWLLVQIVETIFAIFELSNAGIRLVVIVLAIGFPLALIFSWLYEFTPQGIKLERDIDNSRSAAAHSGKALDRAIIVVLTLAIGYFAVDKFVLDPARDTEFQRQAAEQARDAAMAELMSGNRIAVLPFTNLSASREDDYLSEAFSYQLNHLLSPDGRFVVIATRASFSFRDKDIPIVEIARQLEADYLIDGSVLRTGDNVRITAELIDTRTNISILRESYNSTLSDPLTAQNQVSAAFVESVKLKLDLDAGVTPAATATTVPGAHDAYLRGRYLIEPLKLDLLVAAVGEFERAIELDPDYALGYAELAIALRMQGCNRKLGRDCDEESGIHAKTALELNPQLPEAHLAYAYSVRREDAPRHMRRAIELNPNYADAWALLANVYLHLPFRHADRLAALDKALSLDPLSRLANWDYVFALIERGMLGEANRQIEKFSSIDPPSGRVLQGLVRAIGGNWGDYILAYLDATQGGANSVIFGRFLNFDFNWQLLAIGLDEEVLQRTNFNDAEIIAWFLDAEEGVSLMLAQLKENPRPYGDRVMGNIFAHAGRYDEARPHMENVWRRMPAISRNDFMRAYFIEAMVTIYRQAGDEAGARVILAAANDAIRSFRDAGITGTQMYYSIDYLEGITRYLEGDHTAALRLISKAADDGFDILPLSPFQQERYQDPGFAEVRKRQEARREVERNKVLEVTCAEGFSHPVWVPTEETCQQYLGDN